MNGNISAQEMVDTEVMKKRYINAQRLLQGIWTDKITYNDTICPIWIEDCDCFWYERVTNYGSHDSGRLGKEYRLVDANNVTNSLAFDHKNLADTLAEQLLRDVDSNNLPIKDVNIKLKPLVVDFTAFDRRWEYHSESRSCQEVQYIKDHWLLSPDGRNVVFTRDHNLWIRELDTGSERALTRDGEKDNAYAALPTAWGVEFDPTVLPQAEWSPDSSYIFTVQRDRRTVEKLPVVHHVPMNGSLRPQLEEVRLAMPGDENIETLRLVSINVNTGQVISADYHQIAVNSPGHGFFREGKGWWGSDARQIYFIDIERGYKSVRVVAFDPDTGVTRVVLEESTDTQINLSLNYDERPTFLPIPESNELLWFSERTGWAHLYLYDLESGDFKRSITEGKWLVRSVLSFDAKNREVFVQTAGRGINSDGTMSKDDRDPYYCDLARINIDTGDITTLIASDHEYFAVSPKRFNTYVSINMGRDIAKSQAVSPTGNFVVVTRSRADQASISLLLDRDGSELMMLEEANISALPDDWLWPEPVKLMAADGKTDIYGLVFRPSHFSPDRSYPIISHTFNTPEFAWVSKGSFNNGVTLNWPYLDAAALAELGFIVVQIDGRGTPNRHKHFQDESYGCAISASNLDDHVAGIKQLASMYHYMDINRVGITCHLSGGLSGVQGLLDYPDFYKVGVNAYLHDIRLMSATMVGEKWEGVAISNYKTLESKADNLQGKLLLFQGLLNRCVPPAATFRLVEALQKANKDFDLILMPNVGHAAAPDYLTRRTWDYFVTHLIGSTPPKCFNLTSNAGGYEV